MKTTATALGIPARPARNLEMLTARLADSDVRGLIVDLEAGSVVFDLIAALRGPAATEAQRGLPVVAFGPHVNVAAMEAAREAGATRVLTRGAFDHSLEDVLRQLEG